MGKNAELSRDFPLPSLEEWRAAAAKALKGDVSALDKKSEDGIALHALYTPGETACAALAPANGDFIIRPRIDLPDIGSARGQALEESESGCSGLIFTVDGATAQPFGVPLKTAKDVECLLKGLPSAKLSLRLDAANDLALAQIFLQAGFARAHPGFDFIGRAAFRGLFADPKKDFAAALELLEKHKPEGAAFLIDARLYHNAGASDAQELGLALATAAENLRQICAHGISPQAALRRMSLLLATDARQFASIAKLRAMRLLWARFSETIAGKAQAVHMSAETSFRMLSAKDAYTNLIRNTLAAFAAIAGGAEKITVLPFTSAIGLPDAFARRLARNTLHLLRDESHAAMVQDAARGSAYVEELTLTLAQAAWKIFQNIEKQGGMLQMLASGEVQRMIAEKREARLQAHRRGEKKIVGITDFIDPQPREVAALKKSPAMAASKLALRAVRTAEALEKSIAENKGAAA